MIVFRKKRLHENDCMSPKTEFLCVFFFIIFFLFYNTKQYFKLLFTLLYIHITLVYKITLTKYKLRECYRLQIERTLCIIIFLSRDGVFFPVLHCKKNSLGFLLFQFLLGNHLLLFVYAKPYTGIQEFLYF